LKVNSGLRSRSLVSVTHMIVAAHSGIVTRQQKHGQSRSRFQPLSAVDALRKVEPPVRRRAEHLGTEYKPSNKQGPVQVIPRSNSAV